MSNENNLTDNYLLTKHNDLIVSMQRLGDLSKNYYSNVLDLVSLEELKRKLLSELQYYTELVARVKTYKAGQTGYLEEHRKRIKSEAIDEMVTNKNIKKTTAELTVYNDELYKAKLKELEKLRTFFIKAEDLQKHFNRVLDAVIQSISVAAKERGA